MDDHLSYVLSFIGAKSILPPIIADFVVVCDSSILTHYAFVSDILISGDLSLGPVDRSHCHSLPVALLPFD